MYHKKLNKNGIQERHALLKDITPIYLQKGCGIESVNRCIFKTLKFIIIECILNKRRGDLPLLGRTNTIKTGKYFLS